MADTIFIIHFIILLTFRLCSGGIGLIEDDTLLDSRETPESHEPVELSFETNPTNQRRFSCLTCDGPDCAQTKICNDAITCMKSKIREINGKVSISRGCIANVDQMQFICNKQQSSKEVKIDNGIKKHVSRSPGRAHIFVECCQSNFCNNGSFPILEDYINDEELQYDYVFKLTLAILGPMLGLGITAGGVLFCVIARKTRKKRPLASRHKRLIIDSELEPSMLHYSTPSSVSSTTYHAHELQATAAGDSTLKEYLDGRSLTSGSGSGLPLLVQRTLAKQVTLGDRLGSSSNSGNGGFGSEVWKGTWHGENVAVKIYFSRDEAAWTRETEVYSQLLPSRHDNILGYVGSDMTSKTASTQLWLVTHYHPLGSLYDHLSHSPHPLTHHQTLNITLSIANGLLYLHTEIHGTRGKPAMSHRNLKSKNILVKTNGGCVIADFALAVTQDRLTMDRIDLKQGAKRYMSPEVIEQTINVECLESFRCADIYSLGLILWEVCRRCISNGVALEYAAPYSEWLSQSNQEPSLEEMQKLVCHDHRRPPLPNRWHYDATLSGIGKLMRECWHYKPAARLPILRVKKTLIKLATADSRVHLPLD